MYEQSGSTCCQSFIAFLTSLLALDKFWLTRSTHAVTSWCKVRVHEWEEVEKVTLIIFVLTKAFYCKKRSCKPNNID